MPDRARHTVGGVCVGVTRNCSSYTGHLVERGSLSVVHDS